MYENLRRALSNFKNVLFPKDYLQKLKARGLKVGENFNMQQGVIIDDSHCWHIEIGDDVTLAPNVHILAHDASTKIFLDYTKIGKVKIGNKVFIGASSVILPGVTVGNNVVIGAGSIVNKDVEDNSVMVGNPAKKVMNIDTFIVNKRTEMSNFPLFEVEYTLDAGVSSSLKNKMNLKMNENFGYIV